MSLFRPAVLFLVLVIGLGSARAWDGVEITAASGQVYHHIYGAPSPVPAWCYWIQEVPTPYFHATNEDGFGNFNCPDFFLAHCDSDSMVFIGTWPRNDDHYTTGAEYEAHLSCTAELSTNSWLKAERSYDGNLTTDIMNLTLVRPSGVSELVLGPDSPDQIQVMLIPGTYLLEMEIDFYQYAPYPNPVTPFEGRVAMAWEDPAPVAQQRAAWDAIKALYR